MKKEKIGKFIFMILFIMYLTLYFGGTKGYYEYQLHQKTSLTEEQIKKFEEDVKSGQKVDLEDYITKEKVDFNNKLANAGKKISYTLSDTLSVILTKFFNFLASFITE